MNKMELRKEKRIPADALPEKYRSFQILLHHERKAEVQTTDASVSGFGILTDWVAEDFILGSKLVLFPLGEEQPVYGTIVHANRIGAYTRVGIRLLPVGAYSLYKKEIAELLQRIVEKD